MKSAALKDVAVGLDAVRLSSAAVGVFSQLRLEQLYPSFSNPRRKMDDASLDELAQSMLAHGIQSPLLVRPKPGVEDEDKFEIVAGHRRYFAASRANLSVAPCIVRHLSDEEAAEVAIVDNLQRLDIPPLDEAEAFAELLDRLLSIPAVAAKVGKDVAYVAKALKLRALTEASRTALTERLITVDHARLLCRLAEDEQNQALKWCIDRNAGVKVAVEDVIAKRIESNKPKPDDEDEDEEEAGRRPMWKRTWEPETVQALKDHIETDSGTPLDRAPWPLTEDWLIADAGACVDCEKNTKANAPLFGDLDTGVAVCTDGGCFKAKTAAFVQIELKAGSQGKLPALRLSWKSTSTPPRFEKDSGAPVSTQVFKYGQWIDVGPKGTKCEHTRHGVTVDWSEGGYNDKLRKPGEVIEVCILPKCKVHKKAYEKQSGSGSNGRGNQENYEQRRAREKKELEEFMPRELPVRRALYDAVAAKLTGDALKRFVLRRSDEYRICLATGFESNDWGKRGKYVRDLVAKAKSVDLDLLLVHSRIGSELSISHSDIADPSKGRGTLRGLAKEFGVDAASIERAAEKTVAPAKAEKPVPAKKALSPEAKKRVAAGVKKAATPPAKKPSPKPAKKAAAKKKGGRK